MSPQNTQQSSDSAFGPSKSDIVRSLNAVVSSYDGAALLQNIVGERLIERLDLVKIQPNSIIDLGSATGVYTGLLQKRYNTASVLGVDIAWKMAAQAFKQRKWFAKQRYVCADGEYLPFADNSIDLVFSNLMLHWLDNPDYLFSEMQRVIAPGGLMMFTTFGPDTLKEMRHSWAQVDKQIHVNRFMDMHDLGDSLTKSGFEGAVMDNETITMNYDDLTDLHSDLKATGEANLNPGRHRSLTGKVRWNRYLAAYQQLRNSVGEYPASWEVIYGHAWATDKIVANTGKNVGFLGNIKINTL
ncbi:MAG: malonyl-[acyl-carrier protein] O-methyltransferase BioC [Gammaproteobacteria bacterium]|nr:MAG: malonyl-[acyl-carrier protein] O-methyltransferase BioC [Gammaproteobacteria bacterium]